MGALRPTRCFDARCHMDKKDKISATIGFAFLMVLGLWAILDPSMMEGYTAIGPRSGLKQLFADYWGAKLGIGLIALGGLALVGLHKTE